MDPKRPKTRRTPRRRAPRCRPKLEGLELRELLAGSNVTVTTSAQLIQAIATANLATGPVTINLVANQDYDLTSAYNGSQDGLPAFTGKAANPLTINGNGATISRNGNSGAFRILEVDSGTVQLNDLTLFDGLVYSVGGQGGAGLLALGGSTTLDGATMDYNVVGANPGHFATGGAIAILNGASVSLVDGTSLYANQAYGYTGSSSSPGGGAQGGAIYDHGGSLTIAGSIVAENTAEGGNGAPGGGAVGAGVYDEGGTVNISGSYLNSNYLQGGAGIAGNNGANGAAGARTSTYQDINGGNGYRGGDGGSGGDAEGGGLYVTNGSGTATVSITSTELSGNSVSGGNGGNGGNGGAGGQGGSTIFSGSVGNGGYGGAGGSGGVGGQAFGGGLYADSGSVTINATASTGNVVQAGGGGSGGSGGDGGTATYDTFFGIHIGANGGAGGNGGNAGTAGDAQGGGIFTSLGVISLANSTLGGNTVNGGTGAKGGNGGIGGFGGTSSSRHESAGGVGGTGSGVGYAEGGGLFASIGAVTLANDTVSANSISGAGPGGPGIFVDDSSLTLGNTLVASDDGNAGVYAIAEIEGTVHSKGHNLIGSADSTTVGLVGSDITGTDLNPLDPGLGPLQDNGGPTPTFALLPGSPAIDAGNNALAVDSTGAALTTDQRGAGYYRITGPAVDIGAYEYQEATVAVSSGSGQSAAVGSRFASDLVALVTLGSAPDANASVTFTAPAGSGTFSNGQASITVTTNASGLADSGAFTAGTTAGSYTITATSGDTSANFQLTETKLATSFTAVSGSGVNNGPVTLTATLDGPSGVLANQSVTFTALGTAYNAKTNSSGVAVATINGRGVNNQVITFTVAYSGSATYATTSANGSLTVAAYGTPSQIVAISGGGQTAPIGGTLGNPAEVEVEDAYGNPVPNVSVTYTATAVSGAFSGGSDSVTFHTNAAGISTSLPFTAGPTPGSYAITATIQGTSISTTFGFTVTPTAISTTSVAWGTSGTAALTTASDGLRLLPSGRTTDLPWQGIQKITVTLAQAATLTAADVTVTGITVANYGPVTISGSGTTYTITLAQSIASADRVTLTISNAQIATFTRRLDVLPGDVNDDGAVNADDLSAERAAMLGQFAFASIFYDIDGSGGVDINDYNAVKRKVNTALPPVS